MSERLIKKGTQEWWHHLAIVKAKKCRKGESATVTIDEINSWIDKLNRNPFKRLWFLLTVGDIHQRDATEAEKQILAGHRSEGER